MATGIEIHVAAAECGGLFDGGNIGAESLKRQPGNSQLESRKHRGAGLHVHDASGIFVWERAKNHGVNDAEDRGVGSNPESERKNRDRSEAGILTEQARGMANILQNAFEKWEGPRGARVFADERGVANFSAGVCVGCAAGSACLAIVRFLHVDVRGNFVLQFAIDFFALRNCSEPGPKSAKRHGYSSSEAGRGEVITAAIAFVKRDQRDC